MQYCLSNCNTAISSRHEHRLTKPSMRHSRTPLSSSNKSKQHPSERHHTAATFVQASRSIQETFHLRGNPSEQFDAALFIKRQYSTPQPTPLPSAHQYPSNFCSRNVLSGQAITATSHSSKRQTPRRHQSMQHFHPSSTCMGQLTMETSDLWKNSPSQPQSFITPIQCNRPRTVSSVPVAPFTASRDPRHEMEAASI